MGRMGTGEKAKDFKSAIKRLFKELDVFKILISVAIILAILSSILSILAPNRLSDLTDELVQEAMDKLTKGRTSFIIAHRLSTIKNADLILVMKDGNIIEQGNHEDLMEQKGFYAELYNSQFEL